jgi:hypothetical protein
MRGAARLILGGGLVAVGEAAGGFVALATLGPVTIALFLLACSLATAATTTAVAALIARRGGPGDSPSGGPPGGPPPHDPDEPPSWWPGFERDFWDHVRHRPRSTV